MATIILTGRCRSASPRRAVIHCITLRHSHPCLWRPRHRCLNSSPVRQVRHVDIPPGPHTTLPLSPLSGYIRGAVLERLLALHCPQLGDHRLVSIVNFSTLSILQFRALWTHCKRLSPVVPWHRKSRTTIIRIHRPRKSTTQI